MATFSSVYDLNAPVIFKSVETSLAILPVVPDLVVLLPSDVPPPPPETLVNPEPSP